MITLIMIMLIIAIMVLNPDIEDHNYDTDHDDDDDLHHHDYHNNYDNHLNNDDDDRCSQLENQGCGTDTSSPIQVR